MFQDFKKFILRGNVIDLAIGVVIGASFNNVVNSLVKDIFTPFISLLGGTPNFSELSFTVRGSKFMLGDFLNNLVSFLIVAAVVYFFIVWPMKKILSTVNKPKDKSEVSCRYCLSVVPTKAERCPNCTSWLKGTNKN